MSNERMGNCTLHVTLKDLFWPLPASLCLSDCVIKEDRCDSIQEQVVRVNLCQMCVCVFDLTTRIYYCCNRISHLCHCEIFARLLQGIFGCTTEILLLYSSHTVQSSSLKTTTQECQEKRHRLARSFENSGEFSDSCRIESKVNYLESSVMS